MITRDPGRLARAGFGSLAIVLFGLWAVAAQAAVTGRIGGRVVATDTGEPVGFADLLLTPADTSLRRVGGLTNADGTFLLVASPGRYTLRVRAISYAAKTFEGVTIEADQLVPLEIVLAPEAIRQEEIVVEARRMENTENAMLAARRKAVAVGDAISAEQVRKSGDKDAAEVLRRVTGLSVSGGRYVFVRGLGERYSSTEIDGVRIASPELNKRVVPLDLVPSNLLENIVVQKTYTADRSGEFGGGDVQVRTRSFPGRRTWSVTVGSGYVEGVTGRQRRTYGAYNGDAWGFGARERPIPGLVDGVPIQGMALTPDQLGAFARSFENVYTPQRARTIPNGSYSATYGDELRLFGRPLGIIQSWSFSRSFDFQEESQRLFRSLVDSVYDYRVRTWTETAQLGGLAALSYRITPAHSFHLRGVYSNSADDDVTFIEGRDFNNSEAFSGEPQHRRTTGLQYVQRSVLTGTLEGNHEFRRLMGAHLDWKYSRSRARREEPDHREITYNRSYWFDGDTAHWSLASRGSHEFGELTDETRGATVKAAVPFRLFHLGPARAQAGFDRQRKERDNFYRRFHVAVYDFLAMADQLERSPEEIFAPWNLDGRKAGIQEYTFNDVESGLDNYRSRQTVDAGFVHLDLPFGPRVRNALGLRVEKSDQSVESFALFDPGSVEARGERRNTDWLPAAHLTWNVTRDVHLRVASARTVSRPDLNELSPSAFPTFRGGYIRRGNPNLNRVVLDHYDLRLEAFPSASEVFAVGAFHKRLHDPIEWVISGGSAPLQFPVNSARARNQGLELEARFTLGRLWKPLAPLTVNSNASIISSKAELHPGPSSFGSTEHPLQGQADYVFNLGVAYAREGLFDASVLVHSVGRSLQALGYEPLPDAYEQAATTLDATCNLKLQWNARVKLSAKNLTDPVFRQVMGETPDGRERESVRYQRGRSYTVSLTWGS